MLLLHSSSESESQAPTHPDVLVTSGIDNKLAFWRLPDAGDVDAGQVECVATLERFPSRLLSLVVAGRTLWVGCQNTKLLGLDVRAFLAQAGRRTNAADVALTQYHEHVGYVHAVATFADAQLLFTASGDATIKVWSLANAQADGSGLELVQSLDAHAGCVTAIVVRHDGRLFSAARDGTIKVWASDASLERYHCVRSFSPVPVPSTSAPEGIDVVKLRLVGDTLFVGGVAPSALSDVGALPGLRGFWCIWNTEHYQLIALEWGAPRHDGYVQVMDLVVTPKHVMVAGTDAAVQVWRLPPVQIARPVARSARPQSVGELLASLDLVAFASVFEREAVDVDALALLSDADLVSLGLPLGARRKLLHAAASWPSAAGSLSPSRSTSSLDQLLLGEPHSASEELINSLRQFVSIRSVSHTSSAALKTECTRAANFTRRLLEEIGMDTRLLQLRPGKNPLVIGRAGHSAGGPRKPKIVVYAHYDVVDVVESQWSSPPFELTGRDGYLYARGATDNKGPMLSMIYAVKELMEEHPDGLPVEIVFLIEGEEENNSEAGGFADGLRRNLDWLTESSPTDVIIVANSYWVGDNRPCLIYGMRGVVNAEIRISGPSRDLHSGVHGGAVHEPMAELVLVLSSLFDEHGRILIDDFERDVLPVSPDEESYYDEVDFDLDLYRAQIGVGDLRDSDSVRSVLMHRWRQPTLTVGAVRSSAHGKTIISKTVVADVSMRTVPKQSPEHIGEVFTAHVRKRFEQLRSPNQLDVRITSRAEWWLGDPKNRYFSAAERAIRHAWGCDPMYVREGGTMPTTRLLEETLGAVAIHIPFGQQSDQAHLEDERIHMRNLLRGKTVFKRFLQELAADNHGGGE